MLHDDDLEALMAAVAEDASFEQPLLLLEALVALPLGDDDWQAIANFAHALVSAWLGDAARASGAPPERWLRVFARVPLASVRGRLGSLSAEAGPELALSAARATRHEAGGPEALHADFSRAPRPARADAVEAARVAARLMLAPWKFGARFPGGVLLDLPRDERPLLRALPEAEAARLVHVVLESFAPSALADPRAAAHLPESAGHALLDLVSALPSKLPLDIDRVLDAGASLERQLTREAVAWTLARAGAERVLGGLARRILGSRGEQRRNELTWLRDIARAMGTPAMYGTVGADGPALEPRPLLKAGSGVGMAKSRGGLGLSGEAPLDEYPAADIVEELELSDEAEPPEAAAAPPPLLLGGAPAVAAPAAAPSTAPTPRSTAEHQPSRPEPLDAGDPVDVAVFCPGEVARECSFLVQVFLYPPTSDADVAAEAREADDSAQRRGRLTLPLDLPLGTRVDLHLEMPALGVLEPDAVVVWRRRSASAQFEVSVPATAAVAQAIGRVRIAIAGTPTATLRFVVKVVATGTAPRPAEPREVSARRYRNAFVSYSSDDRAEVLRRVQAFRIAGLSVFQDVLELKPGELWERALYRYIDECDVFLLFWSSAAAASPWVKKEIEYALARKADNHENPPDIQPVPLEGPPLVPPPPELRAVHFNDALLAHIQAADRAATAPRA